QALGTRVASMSQARDLEAADLPIDRKRSDPRAYAPRRSCRHTACGVVRTAGGVDPRHRRGTMQRFRRILVPVEGVRDSLGPIEHATQLARHFDAEVLILHVDDALPGRPIDEAERRSAARRDLEAIRADLEREKIVCHTVEIRAYPPKEVASVIVAAADAENADLIVMGTHGRSGISRLFGGSVAEEVVRHAPCATLVVRIPEPLKPTAPAPVAS